MENIVVIGGDWNGDLVIDGTCALELIQDGSASLVTAVDTRPAWTGELEYTPTDETQVIQAAGHVFGDNITINPIPSNYGLITWDGSVLTVS